MTWTQGWIATHGHYNVLCLWDFCPGTADLGLSEAALRYLAGVTSFYEAMAMAKLSGHIIMASVAEVAPHLDYPLACTLPMAPSRTACSTASLVSSPVGPRIRTMSTSRWAA